MDKEPQRVLPSQTSKHYEVWEKVKDTLPVLPNYFDTEIYISGFKATDIFTLNTALGATIEENVVDSLNKIRDVWDSENKYGDYIFIRQPQSFPDVLLAKRNMNSGGFEDIAFGIELKGWYVLSKEGEPSFRYTVNEKVCSDLDLVMIVPWYLPNIISGKPKILRPYVESAKYASQYRNYHWKNLRKTNDDNEIIIPQNVRPYPSKADKISDKPKYDSGGNFGRFARTGIMDKYIMKLDREEISGIPIKFWREFFKMFHQDAEEEKISKALKNIQSKIHIENRKDESEDFAYRLIDAIKEEFGI